MTCNSNLSINQENQGDMPLDQAIYSASQDKIYGIRGKWIFKLNATTGVKESEFAFVESNVGSGSICEVNGSLYATCWDGLVEDLDSSPGVFRNDRDIYAVNYGLTTSIQTGINLEYGFDADQEFQAGFNHLCGSSSSVFGLENRGYIVGANPSNVPGTYNDRNLSPAWITMRDTCFDSLNGVIWVANCGGHSAVAVDASNFSNNSHSTPFGGSNPIIFGLAYSPSNNKAYGVTGSQDVVKYNANQAVATMPGFLSNFTFTILGLLDASSKPVRIKYNPSDGLIYIPTWSHDTVEVLNPATDSITAIKTGFTDPFDIVFTPTKKWAVQNSSVGLKEIV